MNKSFVSPRARKAEIEKILWHGQELEVAELAERFGVSKDTIRRDLIALEEAGKVERVYGGVAPLAQPAAPFREMLHRGPRDYAWVEAPLAALIGKNDSILVDGGNAAMAGIRSLSADFQGEIMTPNVAAAVAAYEKGFNCTVIGGKLSQQGGMSIGALAEDQIGQCRADFALISPCAFDPASGLWADNVEEASLKRALLRSASHAIVLCHQAKVGKLARHKIADLAEVDTIVTNYRGLQKQLTGVEIDVVYAA